MRTLIKTSLLYAILVLFCIAEAAHIMDTNLYIISDKSFVGDRSQLLGVARETEKYFKSKFVTIKAPEEYDISELQSLKEKIQKNNALNILVTVGYYGIKSIMTLKQDKEIANRIIAVHLSHQFLDNGELSHLQLVQTNSKYSFGADIIALPEHVLDNEVSKNLTGGNTILLPTRGVAHNLHITDIDIDYYKYKSQIPVSEKYLAVILAGDVPDGKGNYKCYNAEQAKKLAQYVSDIAIKDKYFILLSNGPRTGKYDCSIHKEQNVHNENSALDQVTTEFQRILEKNNVPFQVFDFKRNKQNMYKAILGAVLYSNNSLILVPGESTSMISEITGTLSSNSIIAYYTSVMNPDHMKYVHQELNDGHIAVLDQDMHLQPKRDTTSAPIVPASEAVAEMVYEVWQKKHNAALPGKK